MEESDYISRAREDGLFDSEGVFRVNLSDMRDKVSSHLHGKTGLWLVSLLQGLSGYDVSEISLSQYSRNLELSFPPGGLPGLDELYSSMADAKTGADEKERSILRGLSSVEPELEFSWSFRGVRLTRWSQEWNLESIKHRDVHLIDIRAPQRTHWQAALNTAKDFFPIPPTPLTLDGNEGWPGVQQGSAHRLLISRRLKCEPFPLIRLGLAKEPVHVINFLDRGAKIHSVDLPLESTVVCSEIFVSGSNIETDFGGFSARACSNNEELIRIATEEVIGHLRKLLSDLISRPRLPLGYEEQQRHDNVVGSAVTLGGLAFFQIPLLPPLITLGIGTVVATGLALRASLVRKQQPWRGDQGFRQVRRDLVEMRKLIDSWPTHKA